MSVLKYLFLLLIMIGLGSCRNDQTTTPGSFQIEEGFVLNLVASEPLIMDPVDLEFNEKGEALVLEMPGYPFEDRQSRIMLLLDNDENGVYEESMVYADNLQLASSILPFRNGVLVAAPPYLLHVIDADGDNKTEKIDTLMGGFSTGNLQHNYNGLTFGLDGWIYAANGGNSGKPFWWGNPESTLDLRGEDFRIKIDDRIIERIGRSSGGYELAIDEWGRIYETHNLEHISQLVFPGRYIGDVNIAIGHSLKNVSDHEVNGLARIYPIGEQESRVNHPEQSGYFSGSCGITYYGGGALGEKYNNTVWVTDVVLNLLHIDKIKENGSAFSASRLFDKKEFLASSDRSSRPVNMTVGPDGAMYMVDMYREVIEHPEWIPDEMEVNMDLEAGKDKGRIYRIENFSIPLKPFNFDNLGPAELISNLGHVNQWVRNTNHRLLLSTSLKAEDVERLNETLIGSNHLARLHAMWILNSSQNLTSEQLIELLGDPIAGVRENAMIVAEEYIEKEGVVLTKCFENLNDSNQRVRMQAALTVSTLSKEIFKKHEKQILPLLLDATNQSMDQWNVTAYTLAAKYAPQALFQQLISTTIDASGRKLMVSLAGHCGSKKEMLDSILVSLQSKPDAEQFKAEVIKALSESVSPSQKSGNVAKYISENENTGDLSLLAALAGLRQKLGLPPSKTFIKESQQALNKVLDTNLHDSIRLQQLILIELAPYIEKENVLFGCLDNKEGLAIQEAALLQLWEAQNPIIGKKLVEKWKTLGPQARKTAGNILLYKKSHHDALLTGLEEGTINIGEMNFDLERRRTLLWWTDDDNTKKRAEALFSDSGVVNRKEAIDKMKPALLLTGNKENGMRVYNNVCSQCHKFENIGKEVGPVLTEINRKSKESLLHDILDPNAAVDTKYINHRLETNSGIIYVGIVDQETDSELTIKQIGGVTNSIKKSDVKSFSSLGSSIMMEGLEAGMSTQDMADLLEYLTNLN